MGFDSGNVVRVARDGPIGGQTMTIKEFVARYVPSPRIGALAEVDLEKMLQANTPAIFSQPSDAQLKAAICCGDGECPLKEWAATNNRSLDCETDQFDCRVKAVRALFNAITFPGKDAWRGFGNDLSS